MIKNCNAENKETLETYLLDQLNTGLKNTQTGQSDLTEIVRKIVEILLNGKNFSLASKQKKNQISESNYDLKILL